MAVKFELYLTGRDEVDLIHMLRKEFSIQLLRVLCFSEDERVIESLSDLGKYPTDKQMALAQPDMMRDAIVDVFPEGHRRLHTMDSPVIEFNRSLLHSSEKLKPGRIAYFSKGRNGAKSKQFREWAKHVVSSITSHLSLRTDPIRCLIGKDAASLVEKGELKLSIW